MSTLQELQDRLNELEPIYSTVSQEIWQLQEQIQNLKNQELFDSNLLSTSAWKLSVREINGNYNIELYARDVSKFDPHLDKYFREWHETIYFNDELNTVLNFNDGELFLRSDNLLETINKLHLTVTSSDVVEKLNKLKEQVKVIEGIVQTYS